MEKHQFKVDLKWTQDRKGLLCSPELSEGKSAAGNCIEVATPPEFPKGMPNIWSPEHLFTASVSSFLMTTFLAVAENSNLSFEAFSCKAIGIMERENGKYLMTEILLKPTVTIRDEKDHHRMERVLQKSEAACLISNSIKTKVSMDINIETI